MIGAVQTVQSFVCPASLAPRIEAYSQTQGLEAQLSGVGGSYVLREFG
jgi:hypothetical protein